MTNQEIREIFEAYFEKYKKTEGDRSAWSAFWAEHTAAGTFEIIMTKCPRGTTFKPFANKKKLGEHLGWEAFLEQLDSLEKEHVDLFEKDAFFGGMRDMV